MTSIKTKSIQGIEQRMENLDGNSFRYHVLQTSKNFKTSWIALGRALHSIWKDKLYKDWGYSSFDAYTTREIGIRKQTSVKLLKSYYFLEKEEPQYLKEEYVKSADTAALPNYESVNLLRLAKDKKTLDDEDYARFKNEVFQKGKGARDIKKDLTALMRQREELEPEEAWQKKRLATVKRFLSTLKSLKEEIKLSKLLSAPIISEVEKLIDKLETEVS